MAVPAVVLAAAQRELSGAGSTLRLSAVTVPEAPDAGELTGTVTAMGANVSKTIDPSTLFDGLPGTFDVLFGPCTVSDGGRCVGRPEGYGSSEECEIIVVGGGGVLGACSVFDMEATADDILTLPDGSTHGGSACPAGVTLATGHVVSWQSDIAWQGNDAGIVGAVDNGCASKATCGLPYSASGLGGGWQICFDEPAITGGDGPFSVLSGPCTTTEGGRCVGRAHGFKADEHCAIRANVGGALRCNEFNTGGGCVRFPDEGSYDRSCAADVYRDHDDCDWSGNQHHATDCPHRTIQVGAEFFW